MRCWERSIVCGPLICGPLICGLLICVLGSSLCRRASASDPAAGATEDARPEERADTGGQENADTGAERAAGLKQAARGGRALIVIGLPGDEEHAESFRQVRGQWLRWLTGPVGFRPDQIRILADKSVRRGDDGAPAAANQPAGESGGALGDALGGRPRQLDATRDSLERAVGELSGELGPDDRLWVFFLGHGDHDGERARFHLAGPDIDDRRLGTLLEKVECAEQVVWLTQSCSGWFLAPLSKPGRIVIAATQADLEYNETEFPVALARVASRLPQPLDADQDGQVSVAELFRATSEEVSAMFAADERAPTEHAQLDDNGDRKGTEADQLTGPSVSGETTDPSADPNPGFSSEPFPAEQPAQPKAVEDGELAARTMVFRLPPADEKSAGESDAEAGLMTEPGSDVR